MKVEKEQIEAMTHESIENQESTNNMPAEKTKTSSPLVDSPLTDDPIADEISFDDFAKIDLRIAKIVKAEHVEGADKLLQLTLQTRRAGRQTHCHGCQFSTTKNALWPVRRHGTGCRSGRKRPVHPQPRRGCGCRNESQISL